MNNWRPLASVENLTRRAAVLAKLRAFFAARAVIEVQTPTLGQHTVTDPDVEGIAVPGYGFLQTSPEYFMKRLLAAGMPSCYQLASAFRHGEVGGRHNPEFCMLEWYQREFDAVMLRAVVADLCDEILGPGDYSEVDYADLVSSLDAPRETLDLEFAQACEKLTPGRFFVVNYPADQAALAQLKQSDLHVSERFELIIDGLELANGYWELTNPTEHAQRFARDQAIRAQRGLLIPEIDAQFVAAVEAGLPACAGVALGVDRLIMLALGLPRIDDVLAFRS